jgi:hypothetical protein
MVQPTIVDEVALLLHFYNLWLAANIEGLITMRDRKATFLSVLVSSVKQNLLGFLSLACFFIVSTFGA